MAGYTFEIKTASDLLEKAGRELERFNDPRVDITNQIDHAINFATTAWHIVDWLAKSSDSETFKALQRLNLDKFDKLHSHVRSECPGLNLCYQIATGAKHLAAQRMPQQGRIANTSLSAIGETEGHVNYALKVLVDGDSVRIDKEFEQVMDYWRSFFRVNNIR